jgi:predicted component of type VI protein secretion system
LLSLRLRAIFETMQRLDLTDNERAVLITALRRLVDFDPRSLSPQTHALKAILERLDPHKPQPIPDTASTG